MIKTIISSLVLIFLLNGCGTATLQVQSKMTRTLSIEPSLLQKKVVYLRVTGTSASVLEIEAPLRKALEERSVILTTDPNEATISLHVNTLFANNLKEAASYQASVLGGVTSGAVAKGMGNSSGDSILIGIGVAIAMGVADRALADETYRAVIDISLRTQVNNKWSDEEKTRVLVEAVRMGLNLQEVKPIMEEQAVQKIAEILK